MANKTYYKVSLNIYGGNTQTITESLGIEPTWIGEKGGSNSQGVGIIPHNIWQLDSALDETEELEEHVSSLIQMMSDKGEAITAIAQKFRTVISVGAYYYESNPQIELAPDLLKSAGEMNITIWLDMYFESL